MSGTVTSWICLKYKIPAAQTTLYENQCPSFISNSYNDQLQWHSSWNTLVFHVYRQSGLQISSFSSSYCSYQFFFSFDCITWILMISSENLVIFIALTDRLLATFLFSLSNCLSASMNDQCCIFFSLKFLRFCWYSPWSCFYKLEYLVPKHCATAFHIKNDLSDF